MLNRSRTRYRSSGSGEPMLVDGVVNVMVTSTLQDLGVPELPDEE